MSLQLTLEDLLADLRHARREGDLGRLAWVAYYEVRRWARSVGEVGLAEQSFKLIAERPYASREEFVAHADALIAALEKLQLRLLVPAASARGHGGPGGRAAA